MAVKYYKYNDTSKVAEHFKVSEFKCRCGGTHDTLIDQDLVNLLENLRSRLNAKSINIYSGYRCPTHDKNVGGSGSGPHTGGYAVDMYALDQNGNKIPSSTVALTLEDMGHQKGIGYRCGGGSDASGQIHVDTKNRKWYGDESVSMNKSCCSSFYDYFGIKKVKYEIVKPTVRNINCDQLEVKKCLNVRTGAGTEYESIGLIDNGVYNYYEIKASGDYTWYKISDNQWIAQDRDNTYLAIYEKEDQNMIEELKKQNKELEDKINLQQKEIDNLNEIIKNLESENNELKSKKLIDLIIEYINNLFKKK